MTGMSRGPALFILGNPRSGTTVLRLALAAHSKICIPPECGFALWLRGRFEEAVFPGAFGEFLDALTRARKFETWDLAPAAVAEEAERQGVGDYAGAVEAVYRAYARKIGKPAAILGDKNNFHVEMVDQLHEMFPEARIVWITRDPRDVFCSYLELGRQRICDPYAPRLEQDAAEFSRKWNAVMEWRALAARLFAGRFMALRYEDLVSRPEEVLRGVFEALGVAFEPAVLDFHEHPDEPERFLAWKEKIRQPLSRAMVGRYERDLALDARRTIEEIAATAMIEAGY